jgi:hypothetical protein
MMISDDGQFDDAEDEDAEEQFEDADQEEPARQP